MTTKAKPTKKVPILQQLEDFLVKAEIVRPRRPDVVRVYIDINDKIDTYVEHTLRPKPRL